MTQKLTAAQQRGYDILKQHQPLSPRAFAELMWPDSPAWGKRNRGQRGTNRSGAMAGTMPMNGARLLWKLQELGFASQHDRLWRAR